MMVNFMCQLDWATGYPDIWSNFILDVSAGIFGWVKYIYMWIDRVEQVAFSNVGESYQLKVWLEQKADPPWSKGKFFLPACLWAGTLVFLLHLNSKWNISSSWPQACQTSSGDIRSPGPETLGFRLELCHQVSWVPSLPTANLGTFQPP